MKTMTLELLVNSLSLAFMSSADRAAGAAEGALTGVAEECDGKADAASLSQASTGLISSMLFSSISCKNTGKGDRYTTSSFGPDSYRPGEGHLQILGFCCILLG